MEIKKKFTPATTVDDAWAAVDAFPLEPGDPRYKDFKGMRGDVGLKMQKLLHRHHRSNRNLHLLFTGYRGNGKTTEIYQFKRKIVNEYDVLYFDASTTLDINNIGLTDLLLAIANQTVEFMKDKNYAMPDHVLQDVADWFYKRIIEKTKVISK